MLKGTIVAATLLAMAWALPAWANVSDDCLKGETLVKTAPDRVFAACSRLAEQNVPGVSDEGMVAQPPHEFRVTAASFLQTVASWPSH